MRIFWIVAGVLFCVPLYFLIDYIEGDREFDWAPLFDSMSDVNSAALWIIFPILILNGLCFSIFLFFTSYYVLGILLLWATTFLLHLEVKLWKYLRVIECE